MSLKCTMILGDCLEVMLTLPRAGADMCFADLPYGASVCSWDSVMNLDKFWTAVFSAGNINCPIICTATQPFTTTLINSMTRYFRYDLVWHKSRASGHYSAKLRPLRAHESVILFCRSKEVYNPIFTTPKTLGDGHKCVNKKDNPNGIYAGSRKATGYHWVETGRRYPISVVSAPSLARMLAIHPTQKPVALLDWLIRTYSNPGDNVLDPVSGSGTTAVAGLACGRSVICIEKDQTYFEASVERVRKHVEDNAIDADIEVRS